MAKKHILATVTDTIDGLPVPAGIQKKLRNFAFGNAVPLVGTAGLSYDVVTPEQVVVSIKNKRKTQNHIKGVHAAAMALIAETATGFVVGVNLPGDSIPLIKTMHVDYRKRSKGDMKAVASLTEEQREKIKTEPKGEVVVPCVVTDESGNQPITVEMTWAWVPGR